MIRSDGLGKYSKTRISVADLQIAEDLIVGTILFDDVDDMLDVLPQEREQRLVLRCLVGPVEAVIMGNLLGQASEFQIARRGNCQEARVLQLDNRLVVSVGRLHDPIRFARPLVAALAVRQPLRWTPIRIRARGTFPVNNEPGTAILRYRDSGGIPTGGNQTYHGGT